MAAYRQVYDSRHLQAESKNRDQLQNPTLCNRLWATFTFFSYCSSCYSPDSKSPHHSCHIMIEIENIDLTPDIPYILQLASSSPSKPNCPFPRVGIWTYMVYCAHLIPPQMAPRSVHPFFVHLRLWPTDMQTDQDHAACVTIGCNCALHACSVAW